MNAVFCFSRQKNISSEWALVLGSGLSDMVDSMEIEQEVLFSEAELPVSHVTTQGVRWLAEQGVKRLILTNAAGTIRKKFPSGEWMMLSDHLNLTGTSPLEGGPNFIDMSDVYTRA